MKRTMITVAVVSIVMGAAAWALKGRKERRDPAARIVSAQRGPIEQAVDASGSVVPMNRVEVKSPVGGRIESFSSTRAPM